MARSITNRARQSDALVEVVEALADSGKLDEAERLACSITDAACQARLRSVTVADGTGSFRIGDKSSTCGGCGVGRWRLDTTPSRSRPHRHRSRCWPSTKTSWPSHVPIECALMVENPG